MTSPTPSSSKRGDTPLIDTAVSIQTPEGVELEVSPAGPVARGFAWAIDMGIRQAVVITVFISLAIPLGETGVGLGLIFFFLVEWFYPVYFEVRREGMTPGKRMMGLRVLHSDGTPVGLGASLLRSLVMCVDFFPGCYGSGLISMLVTGRCQRLGDLAAGTIVVHMEDRTHRRRTAKIPEETAVKPPMSLEAREQLALVTFAERVPTQTWQRSQELASILSPLTGTHGKEGVATVIGYARYVMGRT